MKSNSGLLDYITRQAATLGQQVTNRANPATAFPSHLHTLVTALAQLHRLNIYPPLSLVQDLLNLTGGHPVHPSLTPLSQDSHTGLPGLIALRWSSPARIGLVALLLHQIQFPEWDLPNGISFLDVQNALKIYIKDETIPVVAPPIPLTLLEDAAQQIDERLISLLAIVGQDAVAAEPGLPLRLQSQVLDVPILSPLTYQLLGVRICFGEQSGRAIGNAPGAERGQVSGVETSSRTDWGSLLPSQLALPESILAYRYQRGELLFRTRELADPPRLRPTVLLLDVTPPVFGPVEALTRLAAYSVACLLRQAEIPVVLVTTGEEEERVIELNHAIDLIAIWTQRSMAWADERHSLKLANAVGMNLKGENGLEPMVLVLSQPWFGAGAEIPPVRGLRGLFIQYPGDDTLPVLGSYCERWESVFPGQREELGKVLGYVMG